MPPPDELIAKLPGESTKERPLVIAHRGASAIAPENTLRAFKLAALLGADGIELDVHLSADCQPVVIHDGRLNRTTDARGLVSHFTAMQLSKTDASTWFDRRLALRPRIRARVQRTLGSIENRPKVEPNPERVPTLETVFREFGGAGFKRIYVELKGARETRPALLDGVLRLVQSFDLKRIVTLLSFHHDIIKRSAELAPDVRTAINIAAPIGHLPTARSILKSAEAARAAEVALHFSLASRRLVGLLHDRGLAVAAWTANNKIVMRRLVASETDSIITNYTDRLRQIVVLEDQQAFRKTERRFRRESRRPPRLRA